MLRRVKYLLNKLWFITSHCKTSAKQNQRGTASLYLLQPPHTNSAPASPISIQIIISSPPEQLNIHLKLLSGFACLLTFPVEVNHPCLPNQYFRERGEREHYLQQIPSVPSLSFMRITLEWLASCQYPSFLSPEQLYRSCLHPSLFLIK